MKVNTDSVLVGVLAPVEGLSEYSKPKILDIGTGTGVISLILAQRVSALSNEFEITAVEIDKESSIEAKFNFDNSPWRGNLVVENSSLMDFCSTSLSKFDLIVSNPPYFTKSLKSPSERKSRCRHTDGTLEMDELFDAAESLLSEEGKLAVIYPFKAMDDVKRISSAKNLKLTTVIKVFSTPGNLPKRVICVLKRDIGSTQIPFESEVVIQLPDGEFTPQYKELMKDFYLKF